MEKYQIPKSIQITNTNSYWMLMNEATAKKSPQERRSTIIEERGNYTTGNTRLFHGVGSCAQTLKGGLPINHKNTTYFANNPSAFIRLIIPFKDLNGEVRLEKEKYKVLFKSWMQFIGRMGIHLNYSLDSVEPYFGNGDETTVECMYYDIPINHPVFGNLATKTTIILALHALVRYCYIGYFYKAAIAAMEMKNKNPELPEWVCLERTVIKEEYARTHNTILGLHSVLPPFWYSWNILDKVQKRHHAKAYGIGGLIIPYLNPIRMLRKLTTQHHSNNTFSCYSVNVGLEDYIKTNKIDNTDKKYELSLLEMGFDKTKHVELLTILNEATVLNVIKTKQL